MNRYYEAYPRRSGLLTLPPPPLDTPSKPSSTILMPSPASVTNGVENSATWNSYNSEPIQRNNLLERIKPERERTRLTKNISKLQWKQQLQQQSLQQQYNNFDMNNMFGSMTINDVSPRFALKRILLLYENLQYREVGTHQTREGKDTAHQEHLEAAVEAAAAAAKPPTTVQQLRHEQHVRVNDYQRRLSTVCPQENPPPVREPAIPGGGQLHQPSVERIKPERERTRLTKNISKLQWKQQLQQQSLQQQYNNFDMNNMFGSMTINDVSPRFALKRILLLYENLQYREVANFINRLSHNTFKIIINQLPIDLFIDQIPNSLNILEALYGKIFLSSHFNGIKLLKPENVLLQIVRIFVNTSNNINIETYIGSIRKLIKVIVLSEPKLRKTLQLRKRILDKSVEGLGQHGLVGTSDETLTNLHDKTSLIDVERLIKNKMLLNVIEPVLENKSMAILLTILQRRVEYDKDERLIKNKTLLNVIEPVLENKSMAILLTILQRRVEYDKDVLFQFTQLRKQLNVDEEYTVE
ncbi:uncharacterized protein LOC113469083, partial [Diaphorina citri]|uniref:Uncharacterized protein LOC113469083 n=1 Tax=Diaphorina citri TaxID=121845 RepID=A0A3Q0J1I1_DIACI